MATRCSYAASSSGNPRAPVESLTKGARVIVTGRLGQRGFETQAGEKPHRHRDAGRRGRHLRRHDPVDIVKTTRTTLATMLVGSSCGTETGLRAAGFNRLGRLTRVAARRHGGADNTEHAGTDTDQSPDRDDGVANRRLPQHINMPLCQPLVVRMARVRNWARLGS